MTSINSNRVTGLATGIDTETMIKDMLKGEQNKIDKVYQSKMTSTWKQEAYRDIIKDVKGFYDKYFSSTSKDLILSSKVFSTITVKSSNDSVISAIASAGANNVNYKFKVDAIAQSAKTSSGKIKKDDTVGDILKIGENDTTAITINGKNIELKASDNISDVVGKINNKFLDGSVKAVYSEMTGKLSIETKNTGESTELTFKGDLFDKMNMVPKDDSNLPITDKDGNYIVKGSNSKITVFDNDGKNIINEIRGESNSFTIDNITYNAKSTTKAEELVSMTSEKDTKQTVDKMQAFIDEYNKMIENIYNKVTQKKNRDYNPLTEAQKEEMKDEEIEKWEAKAKEGILRNDSELRSFMSDIKNATFGSIEGLGVSLSDLGIIADSDYNKQGQLSLDVDKFTKSLEDNGELVYKGVTKAFEKVKDVTYKYAGSSSGLFVKKAGQEKSSTAINNIFSKEINKYEQMIKKLTNRMNDKEKKLYLQFANLESSMNKLNSQMNYFSSYMGQ